MSNPQISWLVPEARASSKTYRPSGAFNPEQLDLALLEMAGYITSTGSSWAGNVENATFTLITDPFERYLNYRGMGEETPSGNTATEQRETPFPIQHPWWFKKITPTMEDMDKEDGKHATIMGRKDLHNAMGREGRQERGARAHWPAA